MQGFYHQPYPVSFLGEPFPWILNTPNPLIKKIAPIYRFLVYGVCSYYGGGGVFSIRGKGLLGPYGSFGDGPSILNPHMLISILSLPHINSKRNLKALARNLKLL